MNKAEEFYPIWAKENPDKIHSKTLFAEAYLQSRVKAISDERPKIEDSIKADSVSEIQKIYDKSPELFKHIQRLDNYIDEFLKN